MAKYQFYTDGSAIGTSGVQWGGWGVVFLKDGEEQQKIKGGKFPSTNNEMELTAILKASEIISTINKKPYGDSFTIFTDSNYSLQSLVKWSKVWIENGWINSKGEPVRNKELILKILQLLNDMPYINIEKVKGHSGDTYNELADDLATTGSGITKDKIIYQAFKGEIQEMEWSDGNE